MGVDTKCIPNHTKYEQLRLNHLCFADDVLIFRKGKFEFVKLMLLGMVIFSTTYRLTTNVRKSNMFIANKNKKDMDDLC